MEKYLHVYNNRNLITGRAEINSSGFDELVATLGSFKKRLFYLFIP